jgi:hypothetical protein
MTKLIVIILASIAMIPAAFAADAAAPASEAGVFVAGSFTGVCSTPDGTIYLLGRDHRVVRLSPDGQQQSMSLPVVEGTVKTVIFVISRPVKTSWHSADMPILASMCSI